MPSYPSGLVVLGANGSEQQMREFWNVKTGNRVGVMQVMAAEEKHEGVFFVLVDQVHKILLNRVDMIDIFAVAKESKYHSEPPSGNRFSMAEIFHSVAVRDKDKTWR